MKFYATLNDKEYEIEIDDPDYSCQAKVNGKTVCIDHQSFSQQGFHSFLINNRPFEATINPEDDETVVYHAQQQYRVKLIDEQTHRLNQMGIKTTETIGTQLIKAPMPGLVVKILVKEGDTVQKGDSLLLIEAMKMENEIKANHPGVVTGIYVSEKEAVEQGAKLMTVE